MRVETTDVLVIGAGPSGAVVSAMLQRLGHEVLVLEQQTFPRFSIGESLLPQSMHFLEEAGLLRSVVEEGFQHKNGATFVWGQRKTSFDFRDKSTEGWGTAYQVPRARFDQLLIEGAARQGVEVRFEHQVVGVDVSGPEPMVQVRPKAGDAYEVRARLVLDASGFARLLPRLLDLELPSAFPVRQALFTHVEDRIGRDRAFDRNKIHILVHPRHLDVWYWLIPFSDGRSSLGVVAEARFFDARPGNEELKLKTLVTEEPLLCELLADAVWDTPVRSLRGYAANVKRLHGPGFALLGNAGEFLDPIFSSGVTIAFMSASLAARSAHEQLLGKPVDWEQSFALPLKRGVDTFRAFVDAWYRGAFQRIIFHPKPQADIRRKICAILAGYAWDQSNPYVAEPARRLAVLEQLCEPLES